MKEKRTLSESHKTALALGREKALKTVRAREKRGDTSTKKMVVEIHKQLDRIEQRLESLLDKV